MLGDLFDGLRAVKGTLSSLFLSSSLLSKVAKTGSLSFPVPFAPLTSGTGWSTEVTTGTGCR